MKKKRVRRTAMQEDGSGVQDERRADVARWFDLSSRRRNLRQPLHGVDGGHVLDDVVAKGVKRVDDADVMRRGPAREPGQEAPGAGEWRGPTLSIRPGRANFESPDYVDPGQRWQEYAEYLNANEDFHQALRAARGTPHEGELARAFLTGLLTDFNDRRGDGHVRQRPTGTVEETTPWGRFRSW
jgi:hypothetical protein